MKNVKPPVMSEASTKKSPKKTTLKEKVGVAKNPYLKNGIKPWARHNIRKQGTAQQKQWLWELEQTEVNEKERAYRDRLKEEPAATKAKPVRQISQEMIHGIFRRQERPPAPSDEMYQCARGFLFDAYRAWVFQRRSEEPIIVSGDEISVALGLVAHWLVGLETWQGKGEPRECLDPRKGLYFCGDPGNGKSSVAIAAASASAALHQHYQTGGKLTYRSMNQVVTDIMTTGSLKPLSDLSKGGLVLDELRLEHLTHKHYGNDIDIMADVLLQRWESWNYLRHQTIITSNITPGELADNLQDDKGRIRSRLRDQFQLIKFTGPSFREAKMKEYDLRS